MTKKQSRVIWTFLGCVVVVVVGVMAGVVWLSHTQNTGNDLQRQIVGLQQRMEESVSSCLETSRASTRMSAEEFEVIKRVLVNAAMARYENDRAMLASGGSVVTVLYKTHPEIDVAGWDAFMSVVVSCRQAIDRLQQRLHAIVAELNEWRLQDDALGVRDTFPDEDLKAIDTRTGQLVSGLDALEALTFVIADEGALNAGLMPAQSILRSK